MNILLVGERYSANLGDAVICETVSKILESHNEENHILSLDISGRTDYGAYYNVLSDFGRMKLKHYIKIPFQYADCLNIQYCIHNLSLRDLLGILAHWFSWRIFWQITKRSCAFCWRSNVYDHFVETTYCITKRLSKSGIRTNFYGCGSGRVSPRTEKLLKKMFAFPNVESISVRDSYNKIRKLIDESVKLSETFDAAINCSRYYPVSPPEYRFRNRVLFVRK